MIAGLDSASEPSAAQAQAAKVAGIRLWSGYIATQPNVGLYHPWPRSAFENARLCGGTPIAYASGWDDPATCKALAASWNVRLCLDIEGGIRGNGSWAQNWLDASGAGVYGNAPVHRLRAAFHVLAAYPGGDPQAPWPPSMAQPATPCGWQFQGTHREFGIGVDRGWFDDWFAGLYGGDTDTLSASSAPREATTIVATQDAINLFGRGTDNALWQLRWAVDTGWLPWASLGGEMSTPDIAATQRGDQIDVFVIGKDGGTYHIYSVDQGVTWSGYEAHGGQLTSPLVAIASVKTSSASSGVGGLTAAQDGLLSTIGSDVASVKRRIEKDLAP